jgi:hypothetical protein
MITNEELLIEIREKAKNGRERKIVEALPGELRSPDAINRAAEDTNDRAIRPSENRDITIHGDAEIDGRDDIASRRDRDIAQEDNSRTNTSDAGSDRKPGRSASVEKPAGLAAAPSTRERQLYRDQQKAIEQESMRPGRQGYKEKIAAVAEKLRPVAKEPTPIVLAAPPKKKESKDEKPAGLAGGVAGIVGDIKAFFVPDEIRTKPFSEKEADAVRDQLHAAFLDYFELADKCMTATARGHAICIIWQSIDDEECRILVNWRLEKAKRDPVAAQQVLMIVHAHQNLKVGIILAPRFLESVQFYVGSGGFSLK